MATAQEEAFELQQAMSLLSPQEREAMGYTEGDETADELNIINQLQDNGDNERRTITELPEPTEATGNDNDLADNSDEDDDADDAAAVQAAADALAAEKAAAEAAKEAPAPEPAPAPAPAPAPVADVYVPPPVENYDERVAAIHAERKEAMAQLLAGELNDEEHAAIDQKTLSDLMAVSTQQAAHVNAVQQQEAAAVTAWQRDIAAIKASAKAEGIDYDTDPKMGAAWDRWVRTLGADPDNQQQPADWFLKEAHRLTKLQYNRLDVGQEQAKPNTAPPVAASPKAPVPTPKTRAPDLSQIPPTLGSAPAAAIESEGDAGEFAYIDKLEGIARERALARLTPDQEARYLES